MKLTPLQETVLALVREHGPITAADVAYHWPMVSVESARGVLARLEAKSLIDATYTGHGSRARAFVARRM